MKLILLSAILIAAFNTSTIMAQNKIKQTAGREQLGEFAPKFAELNDDVLFGEVWSRTDKLSLHDRSMITITSLVSMGIVDSSLTYHLQTAKANGVTKTEISEMLTHIGFYAGWPKVWAAFRLAKEVWNEPADMDGMKQFQQQLPFPIGNENTGFSKYFIGKSYLEPLSPSHGIYNVTFEPRCRNNWHIHHADKGGGQILICMAGRGWYQEWGKPARMLQSGDVVETPANTKHWHGAAVDSWFSHIAIEVPGENTSNEWLEPVADNEYDKLEE